MPAFYIGTRGLVYFHVKVRTGERDLHSGVFGGAALNAMHALIQTLAPVMPREPDELRERDRRPDRRGARELGGDRSGARPRSTSRARRPKDDRAAEEFYERTLASRRWTSTVSRAARRRSRRRCIPVEAEANVSIRLAPVQDVEEIALAMERLMRDAAPAGRRGRDRALVVGARRARPRRRAGGAARPRTRSSGCSGRRPLLLRSGGTLPIVPALADKGIPTILSGFDLPDGNVHAPNERLLVRVHPARRRGRARNADELAKL